jgi:hypothetical protein
VFVGGPAFAHEEAGQYTPGIMLPYALSAAAEAITLRVKKEQK